MKLSSTAPGRRFTLNCIGLIGLSALLVCACATPDSDDSAAEPHRSEARAVVDIFTDGTVWVHKKKYYDPSDNDGYAALSSYISSVVTQTPIDPTERNTEDTTVEQSILIRIDQWTMVKHIRGVLDAFGNKGIKNWTLRLVPAIEMKDAR